MVARMWMTQDRCLEPITSRDLIYRMAQDGINIRIDLVRQIRLLRLTVPAIVLSKAVNAWPDGKKEQARAEY